MNPTDPNSPTPADVHKHLSVVQVISLIVCVLSAVLTGLQSLPPTVAWVAPTTFIISGLIAACGAFIKAYNVPLLLLLAMVGLSFGGCSNLTPVQHYRIDAALYNGSVIGLTAGIQAGKIPPAVVPQVQADLALAKARLDAAAVWIAENPNLANVVGVYPPSLDPLATALTILDAYVRRYGLVAPLAQGLPAAPPGPAPATAPAK